MGRLSTHVLDTAQGMPAEGVSIRLYRLGPAGERTLLAAVTTNSDGRTDAPLLEGGAFVIGTYELIFEIGAYFDAMEHLGVAAAEPFLDQVPVLFTMAKDAGYHVPLLVTPWSYSTYRGS